MIKAESFSLEHMQKIRRDSTIDASILERSIFALALVEALVQVGLPFIFKGGTSLLLLLEKPRRLSTDIDIIVEPGTDVWPYLDEAAKIYPFKKMDQQLRKGKNNIEKRHVKFTYDSPVQKKRFYILLDILYEKNHYAALVKREVRHKFLQTEEPYVKVSMPSINCILGDKMTAFAPHTTGILITEEKELEIIKQLYDVATLIDAFDSFDDTYDTYMATVSTELAYRGLTISAQEVLQDTLDAATCIAGRGKLFTRDYSYYLKGIRGIMNHMYKERFNAEKAVPLACKVMYFAACLLTGERFERISDPSRFLLTNIGESKYAQLSFIRKVDMVAFAYVAATVEVLQERRE